MRTSEELLNLSLGRLPRRTKLLILACVLAVPVAVGVRAVASSLTYDAAARRSMHLAGQYERARSEASLLAAPGAVRRVRAIVRSIDVESGTSDGARRTEILRALDGYARVTSQLIAARTRGADGDAAVLSRSKPLLARAIAERLSSEAHHYRVVALASMSSSRHSDAAALLTLLALSVLAPLLLLRSAARRRTERESTERERERLQREALTDNLTRLRNHRAFQEDLGRELERRNRTGGVLSLMMIDLDGLKQVNDAGGHQAGDEAIRCLAECLRETMRTSDLAYRVGGDEFTAILPSERAWGAFELAQRLRARAIAKGIGVAIGITETMTYELKDTVVRRADLALIDAKRSNRNTVIYSDDLKPPLPGTAADGAEDRHAKVLATALARAVDAKDRSTRNHCETVSELCVRIGAELGLSRERLGRLRLAGLLHDVGKIGISDAILQKPAPLDLAETGLMRTHTQIGHEIMTAAELHEEAEFVLHHHERMDGQGYPHALAGEEIPLESRIILVADTFEAITSTRPYRERRAPSDAFRELEQHSGSQFDPACVDALRRSLGYEEAVVPAGATVTPLRRTVAA